MSNGPVFVLRTYGRRWCYGAGVGLRVLHRLCVYWRFRVVMTRRMMLGPVDGAVSDDHLIVHGFGVVRRRRLEMMSSRLW